MLGAVIDHDIDDDPATTAAATAGAIHLVCVNYAPWTTRAPILHELVQWIAGIFIRMLFPLRIGKVDSVGSVVIFVFESREKLSDYVLFGPVTIRPHYYRQYDYDGEGDENFDSAPTRRPRIVRCGIQQAHSLLSIMDSWVQVKVPMRGSGPCLRVSVGKVRELRSRGEDLPVRISFRERNVLLPSGMKTASHRALVVGEHVPGAPYKVLLNNGVAMLRATIANSER